ncbi:MAG: type I DNA topoisomerase [Bacteroidetes bacterium]|uniref:DNA topoisomerase 1 n=1 Tax=Phaeocystidibacter marisrubri TaxID=1577780 RepID=A0A6L3ZH11_9FLAO|nr:type I DNA topoisomerase [Phaeocystidibacter marisrubri]KAB2816858.1 type I DNA topoisomerase [Phaeocystidibacter marisrubri]TNE29889.1 MAG: type I DNA topoisomerase [Bacteroidota bacterium]GGH77849.1 DNA topoisomerase 1 [Phaeocystidibacter marisrubri]
MSKNLVIVESPAKAKTIEKILGKEFKVESSFGHIRDLVSKGMGVEIENNFKPIYEVSKEKRDVVKKLKKMAKEAETVWLASDEDREGEAIAWHLAEALDLDPKTTNRIVFHEITKTAIVRAVENPRRIDTNLVNAQQARRILDRLVGFELSPVLWKKVRRGLSAGRVQSVSVRLIVEREREIRNFETKNSFRVVAQMKNNNGDIFQAELNHRFEKEEEAMAFLETCKTADMSIVNLETKPAKRTPAPPFTTSTLQQEASRKLSFSVSQTMSVAQRLYESGMITYMRTDSVNLSQDALSAAQAEISSYYGEEYSHTRQYSNKNKGAQEAHEAIRPTSMANHAAGADRQQKRLYDLIWKRTIASQMADAKLERTTAHIEVNGAVYQFVAKGEVIQFDGFLRAYLEGTDDEEVEEKNMLPRLTLNEKLSAESITATERFTKHPPRFTEASLVKKLEELGIGRPSTYAPTISTIQKRGYVEKSDLEGELRDYQQLTLENGTIEVVTNQERTGADKGKMIPTDIGMVVNDFLVEHFDSVMDYHFTANVENEFDRIAEGNEEWVEMLNQFYGQFHAKIEDAAGAERASGERLLGQHPDSGKPIYAKVGRYGPMVQMGDADDEEKPQFASIPKDMHIDSIELNDALELFKLPRVVGEYKDKPIKAAIGRFGPYVQHEKTYASLKDDLNPLTVDLETAIQLIEEKREQQANRNIKELVDGETKIEVLNGPYGPYLKSGKRNFRIPKGTDAAAITLEEAKEIIAAAGEKKPAKKKAPKKKK